MDMKNILVGAVAATAVSVASASGATMVEKQTQAKMMTKLLGGVTAVVSHPECTVKGQPKK